MTDTPSHKTHEERLDRASEPSSLDGPFIRYFVVALTVTLAAIAALSIVVDPFARFGVGAFPPVVWLDRDEKTASFEELAQPPEQLVLGSSRIMKANPSTLEAMTDLRTFNFGVNSARAEDLLAITRFAFDRDPEIRSLLVAVDPEAFASVPVDQRLLASESLGRYVPDRPMPWDGLGADVLSVGALSADARSLRHVYGGVDDPETATFGPNGFVTYVLWEREQRDGTFVLTDHVADSVVEYRGRFAGFERLDARRVSYLRALVRLAHDRSVDVVTFILPLHPDLEEALATTTWAARRSDTNELLRALAREGLCTHIELDGLESFGGSESGFFDGAHMDEANIERLLRFVVDRAHAIQ